MSQSAGSPKTTFPTMRSTLKRPPGAAEEVIQRTGKRAIPQFVIDGAWVQPYVPGEGFKYQEMAQLFGVPE
jgi:hypothetical protein